MNPEEALDDVVTLGRTLRAARKRVGLSVAELAAESDVSPGLISQLERGIGNPAWLTLARLTGALGLSMGALVVNPGAHGVSVVRAGQGRPLAITNEPAPWRRELLTPRNLSDVQMIRTEIPPGASNEQRPYRHLAVECVHVVAGTLQVNHGRELLTLRAGDTATYDCTEAHWWSNPTDEVTVVIGSVVPIVP